MEPINETRRYVIVRMGALATLVFAARVRAAELATPTNEGAVMLENDKVRVLGVAAKPGQSVLGTPGQARLPHLAVFINDATLDVGNRAKPIRYKMGDVLWDAGELKLAQNAGKTDVVVYWVEPKGSVADAKALPERMQWKKTPVLAGGRNAFENDTVRVIEHSARPRMGVCGEGMHTHPPHLTIGLVDGRVKIMRPDKEPIVREPKAGRVFWDDSGPHAIQNLGSRNSRALLIEIKTA